MNPHDAGCPAYADPSALCNCQDSVVLAPVVSLADRRKKLAAPPPEHHEGCDCGSDEWSLMEWDYDDDAVGVVDDASRTVLFIYDFGTLEGIHMSPRDALKLAEALIGAVKTAKDIEDENKGPEAS